VRGYAWNVFGTFVAVFLILIVGEIVISAILLALPYALRNFIADVVAGTLVAPFLAAVVTLVYYRLTAAHGEPAEAGARPGGGYGQPDQGPGGYGSGGYGSGGYGSGGYGPGPADPGDYGQHGPI
jgi:uncharacterized membrane protein YgcG